MFEEGSFRRARLDREISADPLANAQRRERELPAFVVFPPILQRLVARRRAVRVLYRPGASAANRPQPRLWPNSLTLSSRRRLWLTTWFGSDPGTNPSRIAELSIPQSELKALEHSAARSFAGASMVNFY